MENTIRASKQGETTVITLKGILDNELASNLISLIEKSTPPIVIDMKEISFIYTLGSLAIFNFYNKHKQKPAIKGANPYVISMLQLSGTARYVEFLDSPDDTTQPVQE